MSSPKKNAPVPYQFEIDTPKTSQLKKYLVLDLDETLLHSSFEMTPQTDFQILVEQDGEAFIIYIVLRPGVIEFLENMSSYFNLIIFTASMPDYANQAIDKIDPNGRVLKRYFRNDCRSINGALVKDLTTLSLHLKDVIIIDVTQYFLLERFQNSEISFLLQPENGILISNFFFNKEDRELYKLYQMYDVRPIASSYVKYRQNQKMKKSKLKNQSKSRMSKQASEDCEMKSNAGTQLKSSSSSNLKYFSACKTHRDSMENQFNENSRSVKTERIRQELSVANQNEGAAKEKE